MQGNKSFTDYTNKKIAPDKKLSVLCTGGHYVVPAVLFFFYGMGETKWAMEPVMDTAHVVYYSCGQYVGYHFKRNG
jgi:hypothetical protein